MIFNPAAGRGRGARRISTYRRLLAERVPEAVVGYSERPGGEAALAERALREGFNVIVAVGGDGTWSNVADRVLASGHAEAVFGILPNGTGNDFSRNLGFRTGGMQEAVRVLAEGHVRPVDVGELVTPSASEHDPERFGSRYFLNLIGFGFDIAVIDAAARARFLRGALLYKLTALQQLFKFPGVQLGVESSAGGRRDDRHLMLTVSNGAYFGGGFPIAPGASVDDGLLHACRILDAAPMTRLKLFNLAEKGRHVASEYVEVMDGRCFRIFFAAPPRFEMDGDVRRSREPVMEVRVRPAALRVIAPAP